MSQSALGRPESAVTVAKASPEQGSPSPARCARWRVFPLPSMADLLATGHICFLPVQALVTMTSARVTMLVADSRSPVHPEEGCEELLLGKQASLSSISDKHLSK